MPTYEKHLFICTHGPFCWFDGQPEELLEALKKRVAEAGLRDSVRINRSGCLNACGLGPAVVVYPEAIWYGNVQVADADALFQSLAPDGQPVDRLRLPADFTKQTDHYPQPVQQYKRVERSLDDQRRAAQDAIRAELREVELRQPDIPPCD
jgi:(2Fe-2S) ferredoxin